MVGFLMVLLALLVGGIVYTLLRFSAEEEARASADLEAWRARSSHHAVPPVRGPWSDDDAA